MAEHIVRRASVAIETMSRRCGDPIKTDARGVLSPVPPDYWPTCSLIAASMS
jgi:hypothetical protein